MLILSSHYTQILLESFVHVLRDLYRRVPPVILGCRVILPIPALLVSALVYVEQVWGLSQAMQSCKQQHKDQNNANKREEIYQSINYVIYIFMIKNIYSSQKSCRFENVLYLGSWDLGEPLWAIIQRFINDENYKA